METSPEDEWLILHKEALAETDSSQRLAKIEAAERSIKLRLRRIIEQGQSTSRERLELEEALYRLRQAREGIAE